ncbi:MAG: hypothetical protein PUH99_04370 [Firmicutes bacterium]|nr:hypothetical protein [Bacillota bacterium]MDY5531117.1 hypothetical protein [Pumilibacteraceae bacterium]
MKDLIIGMMLGGAAATALLMTDCGCRFICLAKKKLSAACKCVEKEMGCLKDECKQAAEEITQTIKSE